MSCKKIRIDEVSEELAPALQLVTGNEISIIDRRETGPLLLKAQQLLAFYDEAMNCNSAVLDKNGQAVSPAKYKKQMRFCEFCNKYCHNNVPVMEVWKGNKYPCDKIHADAVLESRKSGAPYVYACAAGFVYWTSPLYRDGRYAGALLSGQALACKRKEAEEKFFDRCKDKITADKFNRMLEDVAEKNHGEIQAMARIQGLCAWEISEKSEDPGRVIRRLAWQEESRGKYAAAFETNEPVKTQAKNTTPLQLEKESMLLAAFQRGDNETGNKILNELMDSVISTCPANIDHVRFRAMELLVLLSRAVVSGDKIQEGIDLDLGRIRESKTTEELVKSLQSTVNRMVSRIFSFQGISHASVLRKAQRYIWENYTRKISLEKIAKASGLSAPYFSTVFNNEMGENLTCYLNRLRIERAAALLSETGKSLHEITKLCGFEDQSWFSKVFKSFTGVSPGKYRKKGNIGSEENERIKKMLFVEKESSGLGKQILLSS